MEYIILITLIAVLIEVTYVAFMTRRTTKPASNATFYLDTSVLIDGRILEISQTGFITAELVIPRSVIAELQLLADGSDSEKRAKARKGLDNARQLRDIDSISVRILQDSVNVSEGVDNRLLALAKRYGGAVCTIDYNLNKVAQVEGIAVVNVNELAKNIRMQYLPGETHQLLLTQKGNDSHQAIGHLDDGTMVVVEHASQFINRKVEVEFIRSLQTDAGKMMFARVKQSKQPRQVNRKSRKTEREQVTSSAPQVRKRSSRSYSSRPKTAEDNLIALANKDH